MKSMRIFTAVLFIAAGSTGLLSAQRIVLKQSNPSGIYSSGDKINVTVSLEEMKPDTLFVRVLTNNKEAIVNKTILKPDAELVIFDNQVTGPASLIFTVKAEGSRASIGSVVDPDSIGPGSLRPDDLDHYWRDQKRSLKALPMDVQSDPVDGIEKGYTCSDVEINCLGPKPARGYFARPEDAAAGTLPIVLNVHAAGVAGSWCLSQPENAMRYARMGKGALCFDLNAHGMLNGQPQSYYDDLEKGELKDYYYQGVESREDYYFRGMYLRLLRTLEFLTQQPEWDGKRILVVGESQGGGQALVAAALDHRVTAAVATVPAMCDFGARFADRSAGWPDPLKAPFEKAKMLETVPYFDAALLLKDCPATLVTEIGYIDMTCPATSVYAAINQATGKKITFGVPYRGHHLSQQSYRKTWQETVYDPKMEFIADFLK